MKTLILIILIYFFISINNSSLVVYKDVLESEFFDLVLFNKNNDEKNIKNIERIGFHGKYSVNMETECYNSFKLVSKNNTFFDSNKYNYLSFWVNSPVNQPPIDIRFHSNNYITKKIPLTSSIFPSFSITKKKKIIQNEWSEIKINIPEDSHINGISFQSSTNKSVPIYIDKIVLVTKQTELSEGIYHLRPSFGDSALGGSNGGHAFWYSGKVPSWQLGGFDSWVFQQDRGLLQVLPNGNIVLSGPIVPSRELSSCHTWFVDFMFQPIKGPSSIHRKLSPGAYTPNGTIDPKNWKFYTPTKQCNFWTATGCNHVESLEFISLINEIPLQLGYGANGKNGKLGLSVWLQFKDSNGHSSGEDYIEINVDLYDF